MTEGIIPAAELIMTEEIIPAAWKVRWKRNRNHRGQEIVYSEPRVMTLVAEKKAAGFKKVIVEALSESQLYIMILLNGSPP